MKTRKKNIVRFWTKALLVAFSVPKKCCISAADLYILKGPMTFCFCKLFFLRVFSKIILWGNQGYFTSYAYELNFHTWWSKVWKKSKICAIFQIFLQTITYPFFWFASSPRKMLLTRYLEPYIFLPTRTNFVFIAFFATVKC